jgi:hypothetical protein
VNVTKYFRMFRNSAEQHVGFDADLRNISDFAAKESPSTQTFIAGLNLISQTPIRYLSLSEGGAIHFVPTVDAITRPSQVLVRRPDLDPNSASIIRQLTERYSEATVETVDPFPGTNSDFTVVSIP